MKAHQFKSVVKVVSHSNLTSLTGHASSRKNASSRKHLALVSDDEHHHDSHGKSFLPALFENQNMPFNPQPETTSS